MAPTERATTHVALRDDAVGDMVAGAPAAVPAGGRRCADSTPDPCFFKPRSEVAWLLAVSSSVGGGESGEGGGGRGEGGGGDGGGGDTGGGGGGGVW